MLTIPNPTYLLITLEVAEKEWLKRLKNMLTTKVEEKKSKYRAVSKLQKIVDERYPNPYQCFKALEGYGIKQRTLYNFYDDKDKIPSADIIGALKTLHPELREEDFIQLVQDEE